MLNWIIVKYYYWLPDHGDVPIPPLETFNVPDDTLDAFKEVTC